MKILTIDSSVIGASLIEKENRHTEALQIWQSVLSGDNMAIMPYSILVEVVAAVRRRTGSADLATAVKENLLHIDTLFFVALDQNTAARAADIAVLTGGRGMDALVIQVALEFDATLISFDIEMLERASAVMKREYQTK